MPDFIFIVYLAPRHRNTIQGAAVVVCQGTGFYLLRNRRSCNIPKTWRHLLLFSYLHILSLCILI